MKYFFNMMIMFLIVTSCCAQSINGAGNKHDKAYIGGIDQNGRNSFVLNGDFSKAIKVSNKAGLIAALANSKSGTVIYIKDGSQIDLTGVSRLEVRGGVKIIGNRGINGAKGPLLYTTSHGVHPLFEVTGASVVFQGLRIRGAEGTTLHKGKNAFSGVSAAVKKRDYTKLYNKNMYATQVSSAIATSQSNLSIINCELYQWTYTAIYLKNGARNVKVHYCYIHHNQRFGLGYGVNVDRAEASIIGNLFDFNRHSIASTGRAGSSYTAEYNIFKSGGNTTWAVDVHGGKDWGSKSNIAGKAFVVRNNTFYIKGEGQAVVLRGTSEGESIVQKNKIIRLDGSQKNVIEQRNSKGNLRVIDNEIIRSNSSNY